MVNYDPVTLPQGVSDSLGVSIAGGKGSPLGDIPIFIAMIQANGVAAKTQQLKVDRHTYGLVTQYIAAHAQLKHCVCVRWGTGSSVSTASLWTACLMVRWSPN